MSRGRQSGSESDAALASSADDEEASTWADFLATGSAAARARLFSRHAAFARQIARRHFLDRRGGDLEYPDLCQLAYAGLLEAIDRFDPERGPPFRGYSARRVSGSIRDGIAKTSEVRQQTSFRNRIRYERARSLAENHSAEQRSVDEALKAFEHLAVGLALGFMLEGAGSDPGGEPRDLRAGPYESLAWADCVRQITAAVSSLPEREQAVIRGHYFNELDFTLIAALLGLSRSRVSQLHRAGVDMLRKRLSQRGDFRLEQ